MKKRENITTNTGDALGIGIKVLPCPFCGHAPRLKCGEVSCENSECKVRPKTAVWYFKGEEQYAVIAWNKRPRSDTPAESTRDATSDSRPNDPAFTASRSYWLYVWRGSKYRLGHPVEYSEPPQRFTAICDEEAAEIADERATDAVIWELHNGDAMDANTKQIASKHRSLVRLNDNLSRPAAE